MGATGKLPPNTKNIEVACYIDHDSIQSSSGKTAGRKGKAYITKKGDKVKNVMAALGIRPEYFNSYLRCLNLDYGDVLMEPSKGNKAAHKACCIPGTNFKSPQGPRWIDLINGYQERCNRNNPSWLLEEVKQNAFMAEVVILQTAKRMNLQRDMAESYIKRKNAATCAAQLASKKHINFQKLAQPQRFAALKATAKEISPPTISQNNDKDPVNIFEALASDRAQDWIRALLSEEESLDSLNVFLHNQTAAQLKTLGITKKYIIPSRLVFTTKRFPDRTIDRLKVRRVIQGHKWAMKKGVHYDESFTASPTLGTIRLMQALSIGHGMLPHAFDISCAYQNAPAIGPKLAIKYPKGMERLDPTTGEETYAVLQANLNGKADAGRQWGQFRDKWILETFNSNEYTCKRSLRDPCLFIITDKNGHRTFIVCYTDDCDSLPHRRYGQHAQHCRKIQQTFWH